MCVSVCVRVYLCRRIFIDSIELCHRLITPGDKTLKRNTILGWIYYEKYKYNSSEKKNLSYTETAFLLSCLKCILRASPSHCSKPAKPVNPSLGESFSFHLWTWKFIDGNLKCVSIHLHMEWIDESTMDVEDVSLVNGPFQFTHIFWGIFSRKRVWRGRSGVGE